MDRAQATLQFDKWRNEMDAIIRCRDCGGTLMYVETPEGYEVIHSCKDGKQVREMFRAALAEARRAARLEEATWWQQRFQKYLVECGNVDTNVDSGQPEAERIAALHEASKAP